MCDDVVFDTLIHRINKGDYDKGSLMSPPRGSFSRVRSRGGRHDPVPLRGPAPPELYGFKGLIGSDKEKVRIGTLCALRCVSVVRAFSIRSSKVGKIPWLWEQPAIVAGHPHMFNLPEVLALMHFP